MPDTITPIMTEVLECICIRVAQDERPLCTCCQVVSEGPPPMTRCDCDCPEGPGQGWGWIRFAGARFVNKLNVPSRCLVGVWQVSFQAGIYRCITDQDGQSCTVQTADAANTAKDIGSLAAALQCCEALSAIRWEIQDVGIIGPAGGCVGITTTFVVELPTLATA